MEIRRKEYINSKTRTREDRKNERYESSSTMIIDKNLLAVHCIE